MKAETKKEIIWHIKNALTKKFILLPFIAPCYVGIYVWNFLWHHFNDFFGTVADKSPEKRQKFIEKMEKQKQDIRDNAIFAFYALTMSVLYWFPFGGYSDNLTGLQVLNLPTYALAALPIEAIYQLAITPVHYLK
jgi:hypothetical protein